jgi:hypothetical protein
MPLNPLEIQQSLKKALYGQAGSVSYHLARRFA